MYGSFNITIRKGITATIRLDACAISRRADAEKKQIEFMSGINGGEAEPDCLRPTLLNEFVNQVYLPFYRGKWKGPTKGTSESRIRAHIVADLGNEQMVNLSPTGLQAYLDCKAGTHGFSTVDHLRWDLTSICELAVAEKVIPTNPGHKAVHAKVREERRLPRDVY